MSGVYLTGRMPYCDHLVAAETIDDMDQLITLKQEWRARGLRTEVVIDPPKFDGGCVCEPPLLALIEEATRAQDK